MARIVGALSEVSGGYGALFCDLWGCLHDGVRAFPAAVAALRAYRAKGGIVVLLTNSPRPRSGVIVQLHALGVPDDCWDEIASSGDAAQAALVTGAVGRRVFHIGPERDLGFFTDLSPDLAEAAGLLSPVERVPLEAAEGIVCTGLFDDRTETPNDYRATLLLAKTKGLSLLCANPDLVVDVGDRRVYCAGAIAAAYDAMGGRSLYFGKPHPPIYDLARQRLSALTDGAEVSVLAIGDGIATDVAGAQGEGIDTLFVTGGIAAAEFGPDPLNPDPAMLGTWLAERQLSPAYAIALLR